jgi:hypothetical protein
MLLLSILEVLCIMVAIILLVKLLISLEMEWLLGRLLQKMGGLGVSASQILKSVEINSYALWYMHKTLR